MKRSIMAAILAATLLVSMAGMVSAEYIRWDLNNNSVMYQELSHEENGSVTISAGNSYVWQADQIATANVNLAGVTGTMLTCTEVPDCTVQIGYCDDNGLNFSGCERIGGNGSNYYIDFAYGSIEVPKGKYLALNVTNDAADSLIVVTVGDSHIWYCGNATYPTPEITTIAFVGIGLIGLVALGRRRT